MTARRRCLLDQNAHGDGLSIDDGLLIVTTAVNSLAMGQCARGDLAVMSGWYAYEVYVWSTSRVSLTGRVRIGIAQHAGAIASAVGADALSIAYRPGEGDVVSNGTTVATVQTSAERACIGVRVTLSPLSATVAWFVDGTQIHTENLPIGKAWVPAISLAGGVAGDIAAVFNFGGNRWDHFEASMPGWTVGAPGLARITLAHALEAFLSASTDTPPNTPFEPLILSPQQFRVTSQPRPWFQGGGRTSNTARLSLDNSAGRFDALRDADARDTIVVIQRARATNGTGSLADAKTVATMRLDKASQVGARLDVTLRGTLATFDRPLPCRFVPIFADDSARGRIYPVGLGSQRNVLPMLFDEPTQTYVLGDAPMNNVTLVTDGGVPLDPYATPPQWTSALGRCGIALNVEPYKRLSVDCSSVGTQYEIPGAADVLEGIGDFSSWSPPGGPYTTTPPAGWDFSNFPDSYMSRNTVAGYGIALRLVSSRIWYPSGMGSPVEPYYGDWICTTGTPLVGGRSYRLTFKASGIYSPASPVNQPGGLMVRTALSNNPADAISPHARAITSQGWGVYPFTFDFSVPPGPDRKLYFLATASRGNTPAAPAGPGGFEILDVRVELLVQHVTIPQEGITLTDAFRELLVVRDGQDESIFSVADTQAIDAATGYKIGLRWEEQPNLLSALQEACDQFGAVMIEYASGQVGVRRLTAVTGNPRTRFDRSNVDLDRVRFGTDDGSALTTLYGYRRNIVPFETGDFSTDETVVPATQREAWRGTSQGRLTSTRTPAAEYAHAIGAGRMHLRHDESASAQAEGDRVVALYEDPRVAPGGDIDAASGKAKEIELIVLYEDTLPNGVEAHELVYDDEVTVHLPEFGLIEKLGKVVGAANAPFAGELVVTVRYQ